MQTVRKELEDSGWDPRTTASPKNVPRVMQTKFPATIMVLGVVNSEGDVMSPHFLAEGLRLDTNRYI